MAVLFGIGIESFQHLLAQLLRKDFDGSPTGGKEDSTDPRESFWVLRLIASIRLYTKLRRETV